MTTNSLATGKAMSKRIMGICTEAGTEMPRASPRPALLLEDLTAPFILEGQGNVSWRNSENPPLASIEAGDDVAIDAKGDGVATREYVLGSYCEGEIQEHTHRR